MPDQDPSSMRNLLVVALDKFFVDNPSRTDIDVEDLLGLKVPFPAGFIRAIVDDLEQDGILRNYNSAEDVGYGHAAYAFTNFGLTAAFNLRQNSATATSFDTTPLQGNDTNPSIPKANGNANFGSDTWEPLKNESNPSQREEAITAIEDVVRHVETDNGFAASQPQARNSLVYSLRVGIKMLKEYTPSREQVTANILKPLKYISDLFAKHAIGELSKKATEKLMLWLSGF
jgi:hypothetical protein